MNLCIKVFVLVSLLHFTTQMPNMKECDETNRLFENFMSKLYNDMVAIKRYVSKSEFKLAHEEFNVCPYSITKIIHKLPKYGGETNLPEDHYVQFSVYIELLKILKNNLDIKKIFCYLKKGSKWNYVEDWIKQIIEFQIQYKKSCMVEVTTEDADRKASEQMDRAKNITTKISERRKLHCTEEKAVLRRDMLDFTTILEYFLGDIASRSMRVDPYPDI